MMSTLKTLFAVAAIDRSTGLLMDVTLKATLLLVAAMFVSLAMRKNSAADRHRLWALTMLSLLVLPMLPSIIPAVWSVTIPRQVATLMSSGTAAERRTQESEMPYFPTKYESLHRPLAGTPIERPQDAENVFHSDTPADVEFSANEISIVMEPISAAVPWDFARTFVPLVWLCGAVLCLANIAMGTWRVVRFCAASCALDDRDWNSVAADTKRRLGLTHSVSLREHPEPVVPMTLGVLRPIVVLPRKAREWPEQLKRIVLLHELAHVKRRDVAFQWLGRLACVMYWFHPLAWFGLRQLRTERELACDDLVVHCGERATDYAEALVSVAKTFQTQRGLTCAVAMARPGNLEGRMRSLFDKDVVRSHGPLGRIAAVAMLVASALAVSAVSATQLAVEPTESEKTPEVFTRDNQPKEHEPEQVEPAGQPVAGAIADEIGEHADEVAARNQIGRVAGPLECKVKVIDESGKPVEGAKIVPWGFGTENGVGWGWIETWPKEFATTAEGMATIFVSKELTATVPPESGNFTFISFRVEHLDFAPNVQNSFSVNAEQSVTLIKGVTVDVRAINSQRNQHITSDLYAVSSGYENPRWQLVDGHLRSSPFNPTIADTGRYFRVVYAPNEGVDALIMFSDVIDASLIKADDHIANEAVVLHPGVELSGSLSANVERPVKPGGRVIVTILNGLDENRRSFGAWQDYVPIAEDGTFKFAALPRDSHVELIAVCDGWVSKSTVETVAAYNRKYGTEFDVGNGYGSVEATPCRLDSEASSIVVNMEETGICKFKVVDEDENPIELATIMLYPNQSSRAFSTFLGTGARTIDVLRNPGSMMFEFHDLNNDFQKSYTRVTNSSGIAVISNLPNGSQSVMVNFPGYEVVPAPQFVDRGYGLRAEVDIKAGELNQKILRMRKAENEFRRSNIIPVADGTHQMMLRIVDAHGVPLPKAKITLVDQNITTPGKKQAWPADWPHSVSVQGMAVAAIPIPRLADITTEDLAQASIWIDIEADGCVPLKNHEVSLSHRLPIRLQAVDQTLK